MRRAPRPDDRHGVAAVELAVVLPFLAWLLIGVWEVGRLLDVQMIVQNAAGVGGRQASAGASTNAQVQQMVTNYLTAAGLSTQHATVTVQNLTNSSYDVGQATQLDKLQITVSVPFSDVYWGVSGFTTNSSTQVSATAFYYSARVDPYPTNIQAPPGP
jgi:Flp pilus assembly protein TadG